jgi:uncharacterized membrane protein
MRCAYSTLVFAKILTVIAFCLAYLLPLIVIATRL